MNSFKCKICSTCNGFGCINELPGMGGTDNNNNFILNCMEWDNIAKQLNINPEIIPSHRLRLAPMTGGEENAGFPDEKEFYKELIKLAVSKNCDLSIGDGTPDCKLQYGIQAVKDSGKKAAVFIKPYENHRIMERIEWSLEISEYAGIDIDAFNIITMRNKAKLEKKTPSMLKEIKDFLNHMGLPFIIKGIFTKDDLSLAKEVKPDIAYISNHGGRVPAISGSTAKFLELNGKELKKFSDKIWIDGGIRKPEHIAAALTLGADQVLSGRPFITEITRNHKNLYDN